MPTVLPNLSDMGRMALLEAGLLMASLRSEDHKARESGRGAPRASRRHFILTLLEFDLVLVWVLAGTHAAAAVLCGLLLALPIQLVASFAGGRAKLARFLIAAGVSVVAWCVDGFPHRLSVSLNVAATTASDPFIAYAYFAVRLAITRARTC